MAFDLSMGHMLARLPLLSKHPYCRKGFNPAYMTSLQDRMVELMTATGWKVGDIARIAGVTSAAVSQWVGNGKGKQSKSIGNVDAALRLQKASGFSWLWLAQGKGEKLASASENEPQEESDEIDAERLASAIELLTKALMNTDEFHRGLVRHSLSQLGLDSGESGNISHKIADLLVTKPSESASRHDSNRATPKEGVLIGSSAFKDLGGHDGRSDRDAGKRSAKR